eukprot:TRINITY_DN293_c0_g1_i19.p1 TRINITY_DN293_c0_g1~~TRINITY_DN293_c0_g1_i19.p1  ORF type:complete len:286 (-),score=19.48 TRINITY_DN293_c0_g1_i19:65-922(-)
MLQNQIIGGPRIAVPTSSIKYGAPVMQTQPMITGPVQTQYAAPSPVRQQLQPQYIQQSNLPVMAPTTQVTKAMGCPAPVKGQPIIIEGVFNGAQSYMDPVKQTVLLQGAQVPIEYSQIQKGESRFEYIPYEQEITEYDQLEKRIRIPINKYITEYQVVDHQVEYHPEITYETQTDYQPQQKVESEVTYQSQAKRIEHGFNQSMRTSQKIEGAVQIMGSNIQQTSTLVQQPTFVQSTSPVGITYQQAAVPIQGQIAYTSQIPVTTQQWPTPWTNVQQIKKKSRKSS